MAFSLSLLVLVLFGQIYLCWTARPALERRLGAGRSKALLSGLSLVSFGVFGIVWLDNSWFHTVWQSPAGLRVWDQHWISLAAGIWIAGCAGLSLVLLALRISQRRPPSPIAQRNGLPRRAFLGAAALTPFGAATYGTLVTRASFETREVTFPTRNLPPEMDGLRIALLTDIHFGPYLSLPELRRVVGMANETRPHVTLVTGDLITRVGDPLDRCLDELARLRADAGVFGCLGNHEIYARCEDYAAEQARERGIMFLRKESRGLRFGNARLNLAGVDYQRQRRPYLRGAGRLIEPGAVNLLMSHNPDVFPVAAQLGYDLVVGGHTHGGQVTVEILEQTLNVGRFFTPFVAGLYRKDGSSLYVSRGIGTINLPIRLGATPEVTLLRLRQA